MLCLGRYPSGSVVNCSVCSAVSVSPVHLSWLTGLSQDQAEATLQLSPVLPQNAPASHSYSELEIVASWLLALALLGNPSSGPPPGVLMGLTCGERDWRRAATAAGMEEKNGETSWIGERERARLPGASIHPPMRFGLEFLSLVTAKVLNTTQRSRE